MGNLWQTSEFLRQSLAMGVEQCLQVNIDLAQAFATAALYVPIQIVFAVQGVYDFGFGAGSSGNVVQHQDVAERRKFTAVISAGVQVTIIPKLLYFYVTLNYQLQAFQRELNTHPYILSTKEMISLVTRALLGKKFLKMRFSRKLPDQNEFVASLLDMYTFTDGFPTDESFLDRYDALVEESCARLTFPKIGFQSKDIGETLKTKANMRDKIHGMLDRLMTRYMKAFWTLDDPKPLLDCYTYYEAMLDVVYAGDTALTGEGAVSLQILEKVRKERDSASNRYYNETFPNNFTSGGKWYSFRGKHKRVDADPLRLCDTHRETLKCRERLAMCMSLNYDPKVDFVHTSERRGTWPRQVLNTFPEVIQAVNAFEQLYQKGANKQTLIPSAQHALRTLSNVQPTFMVLYKARESTVNACEFRSCRESEAGEESGEMIIDNIRDDNGRSSEWTIADDVDETVQRLKKGPWRFGLPKDASKRMFYYAYAPPSEPGKGFGGVDTCTETSADDCKQWALDVSRWGRSEQALWTAIDSGDVERIKLACSKPGLQIHAKNPFRDSQTFFETAKESGVDDRALSSCQSLNVTTPEKAPLHFRPYVVQRLWLRTVAQSHLAIDQHHRELKSRHGTLQDPTKAMAFSLHYQTTVSFAATLDVSYIDFCKGTGAPFAMEAGITWKGKLQHAYSEDEKRYVLTQVQERQRETTRKVQFVMPDGSVKFFAEWGKGTVQDDFDLHNLERKYELQMNSPATIAAFAAVMGLSSLAGQVGPLVSRTITGDVVESTESAEGLTLSSLEGMILRAWERQQKANASTAVSKWFKKLGVNLLNTAHSGMTCNLGVESVAAFLFRSLTMGSIGSMTALFGAQKAKDLYETAPAYVGAWMGGRLDMLVSHTSEKCHKMLRPQVKAYFRAGFNAPFVSGAYTAAFYFRVSLPLTPKHMVLPDKTGKIVRKQWCGILGNPGQRRTRSCNELRSVFEIIDANENGYLAREELERAFDKPETVDAILGLSDMIGWKGFYHHFGFTTQDCEEVQQAIIKKLQHDAP